MVSVLEPRRGAEIEIRLGALGVALGMLGPRTQDAELAALGSGRNRAEARDDPVAPLGARERPPVALLGALGIAGALPPAVARAHELGRELFGGLRGPKQATLDRFRLGVLVPREVQLDQGPKGRGMLRIELEALLVAVQARGHAPEGVVGPAEAQIGVHHQLGGAAVERLERVDVFTGSDGVLAGREARVSAAQRGDGRLRRAPRPPDDAALWLSPPRTG